MKMSKYTTEVSILNTYSPGIALFKCIIIRRVETKTQAVMMNAIMRSQLLAGGFYCIALNPSSSNHAYREWWKGTEILGYSVMWVSTASCLFNPQVKYNFGMSACQQPFSLVSIESVEAMHISSRRTKTHAKLFIHSTHTYSRFCDQFPSFILPTQHKILQVTLSPKQRSHHTEYSYMCVDCDCDCVCMWIFFLSLSQFNVTFVSPFLRLRYDFAVFFLLIYIKYIYACYLLLLFLSCVLQNCLLQSLNTNLVLGERQKKANLSSLGKPLKKHSTQSNSHSERRESTKPRICMTSIKCRK